MKKSRVAIFLIACFVAMSMMVSLQAATVSAADEVTIVGWVAGKDLVAADGNVYTIAENEKGKELVKLDDKKVKAVGTIEAKGEGYKTFTVSSYEETK